MAGFDVGRKPAEVRARIGLVGQHAAVDEVLTGRQNLELFGLLHHLDRPTARRRADQLLEQFGLTDAGARRVKEYSGGMRRRLDLAAGLILAPPVLFLDEPTAGLDPLMESVFQEYIREAKELGRTVLLSSHILVQVEVLADRISIIRQGRIVETGTLSEMRHLTRTTFTVEMARPGDSLSGLPGVHDLQPVDGQVRFEVDGEHVDAAVKRLAELGVRSLVAQPPTLEQLLLRHYGDEPVTVGEGK